MARKIEPVPEPLKWAHLYLNALEGEAQFKKYREQYRKQLLPWLKESEPDEDGNYYYEFPDPLHIGDDRTEYKGLKAQRRVSELINENVAQELIMKHDLGSRCIKEVVSYVIDYDELYACNQEGIISDEEIDSIIETEETFALVKVK